MFLQDVHAGEQVIRGIRAETAPALRIEIVDGIRYVAAIDMHAEEFPIRKLSYYAVVCHRRQSEMALADRSAVERQHRAYERGLRVVPGAPRRAARVIGE